MPRHLTQPLDPAVLVLRLAWKVHGSDSLELSPARTSSRIKRALVQGSKIGFVKPGVCRQLGYKSLVCLLQQLRFYFVEDFGIADVQPIDGKVGPRLIDVTLVELIL